jgi:MFS family permease
MLFAGILFSLIFIIPFSDKFGRKPLLILNAALGTVV